MNSEKAFPALVHEIVQSPSQLKMLSTLKMVRGIMAETDDLVITVNSYNLAQENLEKEYLSRATSSRKGRSL